MRQWSRREILQTSVLAASASTLAHASPATAPSFKPDPATLESLARLKGLHFGTALSSRGLTDPALLALIRAQCGVIVPENELKMPTIQPTPGDFHFERGDKLLEFAEANTLMMRGHCLLWHHPRWLPRWLDTYDFGAEPARGAAALLTDHIRKTTRHFDKRIYSWDVVNEAVDNVTGEMRETVLSKAIGAPDDVLAIAFRAARETLPETELVYNDYMGWESPDAPHRDGVLRLLERFRKNNVPVNALGLQSHIGSGNQDSNASRDFDARDENAWRKFLEEVTGMGYKLLITEFDVHDASLPTDFVDRDKQVAALGRAFLDITLSFRQVNAVLCWGMVDSQSWLQARTPRKDGLPKRPSPYDNHYEPKLLREAMVAAFRAAPDRRPASVAGTPV